jgi:hypothetical protein
MAMARQLTRRHLPWAVPVLTAALITLPGGHLGEPVTADPSPRPGTERTS